MKRALSLLIPFLLFAGCGGTYVKLARPDALTIQPDMLQEFHPEDIRISYEIRGGLGSREMKERLSAFGIKDVLVSDRPEKGRITLVIYDLEMKHEGVYRYIGVPWSIVSSLSLNLIPLRIETVHPFEIHILEPDQSEDKRLRILHAEYADVTWFWMPFLFLPNEAARLDAVIDTGPRRMLDSVILDVLKGRATGSHKEIDNPAAPAKEEGIPAAGNSPLKVVP